MLLLYPTLKLRRGRRRKIKGGYVLVSNHYSGADIILLGMWTGRRLNFMAKEELFKNRLSARLFKSLGAFPVNRSAVGISTMKKAMQILKDGKVLAMFPEGHRNKTDSPLDGVKSGAALFAIKTRTPLVPHYIVRRPRPFRFNRIIEGEPFTLEEFYDKKLDGETLAAAAKIIGDKILELRPQKYKYDPPAEKPDGNTEDK